MKISNSIINGLDFIDSIAATHFELNFTVVPEELLSKRAIKNSKYITGSQLSVLYMPFIKDDMPIFFGRSYEYKHIRGTGLEITDERFIHLMKNYERI